MLSKRSLLTTILFVITLLSCCSNDFQMPLSNADRPEGKRGRTSNMGPILFISYRINYPYSKNQTPPSQLYSMNEDGTNIQLVIADTGFPVGDAKWSPDGTMIAILSSIGGVPQYGLALYVMNADGSGKHLLTKVNKPGEYYATADWPVWSPDSKRIAFSRLIIPEVLGAYGLFVINVDGTNEQRLLTTSIGVFRITDWLPDGTTLLGDENAMAKDSLGKLVDDSRIDFFNLDGVINHRLEKLGFTTYYGIYSPSSISVAYISNSYQRGGQWINLFNINSSKDTCIVNASGYHDFNQPVAFSPDGNKLLYNAGSGDYGNILIKDIRTGKVNDITPFKQDTLYSVAVSWRRK